MRIAEYDLDDELIATAVREGEPCLNAYQGLDPTVVLGRGSRPEVELELEHCLADKVPLTRRAGGGCAVLLDPGNVIVSLAVPLPKEKGLGNSKRDWERLCNWLIAGLTDVGLLGVERRGISDLAVDDRKISGACLYRRKGLLFYSATVLVEPRMDLICRYLKHPPREPEYRRGRAHADFMVGVGAVLGNGAEEVGEALFGGLKRTIPRF